MCKLHGVRLIKGVKILKVLKSSRQLTCLYIGPFIFPVYVWPKISKRIDLLCIL